MCLVNRCRHWLHDAVIVPCGMPRWPRWARVAYWTMFLVWNDWHDGLITPRAAVAMARIIA